MEETEVLKGNQIHLLPTDIYAKGLREDRGRMAALIGCIFKIQRVGFWDGASQAELAGLLIVKLCLVQQLD